MNNGNIIAKENREERKERARPFGGETARGARLSRRRLLNGVALVLRVQINKQTTTEMQENNEQDEPGRCDASGFC